MANILISRPTNVGKLWHFNLLDRTGEFHFDHGADHVQGMLLLEALRQVAIATAHLQGLPLEGALALATYDTEFFNFLDPSVPITLRSFTTETAALAQEDHDVAVICGVYQWGKLCAHAILSARAFVNASSYHHQRNRSLRIAERQRRQHASRLETLNA
ncbi:MAG: hypothetical protein H6926_02460 [Chromatiales bacterium]|nr:hypothetical protein [Chromatiales bacterium]